MNTVVALGVPTLPRTGATARDRRAFFQLPADTLERARLMALCLCLLLAVDVIAMTVAGSRSRQHWQLALAGEAWLCWQWFRNYQRQRSRLAWTVAEGAALILLAVLAGPDRTLPLMYGGIGLRALLGDRAVALTCLASILAYAGASLLASPLSFSPALGTPILTQAGGLGATACVVYLLASLIRQQEQVMAGLCGWEQAGVASAVGRSREQVYQAALQAALSVVAAPGATAQILQDDGEQRTVAATLGPVTEAIDGTLRQFSWQGFGTGGDRKPVELQFPLPGPSGPEGTLVVTGPRSVSHAQRDGLRVLVSQVAVALTNVRLQEELALSSVEARYRSVVLSTSDLITIVGRDGRIRYQAPSVTQILGYRQPELIGQDLSAVLHPADVLRARRYMAALTAGGSGMPIEWRLRHQDGSWRHVETVGTSLLHDPQTDGIILTSRDISDRKWLEQQLLDQTARDPLTGLANRTLFGEQLAKVLHANRFPLQGAAVLFLDLDNFTAINDNLGHDEGDRLLRAVAERLRSCLRPGDLAARLGGDEFAILLDTDSRAELAPVVAERLLAVLRAPFLLASQNLVVGVSIGIAIATTSADSPGKVLREADRAMCEAKRSGKGRYAVAPMAANSAT
jgi:diguanylate cyclase (GGDEF)-like protein/PAS domain S-box-containing protein